MGQPFAPDVDALFVSAKQDAKGEDELSPKAPNKSPSLKANLSPNRQSREMEGKNFMGLASPGSTARSAEPDPTSIGDVLSVSQLSTEKSFYKVKDVPKAEDRKLDDGEDGEEMPMQRQPSVPMGPSVMPMGRKGEANEAELLVKRVCEGLDGKYGSVDAAFLNMSARFSRLDQPCRPVEYREMKRQNRKKTGLSSSCGAAWWSLAWAIKMPRCSCRRCAPNWEVLCPRCSTLPTP